MAAGRVEPVIIVHGGAWDIPKIHHKAHLKGIERALQAGRQKLKITDDPVATVIEAIRVMEDDPTFDAGYGSFLNAAGEVEMDAGIISGSDLSSGAVAAIQNIKNPIEAANLVRTRSQHSLLVGQGATRFAFNHGLEKVTTEALLAGRELSRFNKLKAQGKIRIKSFFEFKDQSRDTVGAVVMNSRGKIAAGTSTGGTPHKLPGRVGDSPLIGCGFYADDCAGGASSTGWGEGIMRIVMAKTAVDLMAGGQSAAQAAQRAVRLLKEKAAGEGGIILIDSGGRAAFSFNTPYMAVGAAHPDRILFTSIDGRVDDR